MFSAKSVYMKTPSLITINTSLRSDQSHPKTAISLPLNVTDLLVHHYNKILVSKSELFMDQYHENSHPKHHPTIRNQLNILIINTRQNSRLKRLSIQYKNIFHTNFPQEHEHQIFHT